SEYEVAETVANHVDSVCGNLLRFLKQKLASCNLHGSARTELNQVVSRILAQLQNELLPLAALARERLHSNRRQLNHFTIGLFGRSMVGKSTLREAITRGDGSTIGKGAQNTTRDLRPHNWEGMTIIDTPGFGVWDGETFKRKAREVIEQSDLVLFM